MNPSKVYKIVNLIAIVPWAFLIFFPYWSKTQLVTKSYYFIAGFGIIYSYYILKGTLSKPTGNFFSLEGLERLFRNKYLLLAGWIHYLAFDLFVGIWIWKDALQNSVSVLVLVPSLLFTLLFGPFGFLLYYILRGLTVGTL